MFIIETEHNGTYYPTTRKGEALRFKTREEAKRILTELQRDYPRTNFIISREF